MGENKKFTKPVIVEISEGVYKIDSSLKRICR